MILLLIPTVILLVFIVFISVLYHIKVGHKTKVGSYECGFDSWGIQSYLFSVQYFLLIVLFLVFDLEIIFLFPILESLINLTDKTMILYLVVFFFLFITTVYEWSLRVIEWKI